jgi:hypothetical protein
MKDKEEFQDLKAVEKDKNQTKIKTKEPANPFDSDGMTRSALLLENSKNE